MFRFPKPDIGGGVEKKTSLEKVARFKKVGNDILDKLADVIKIANLNTHNDSNGHNSSSKIIKNIKLTPESTQDIDNFLINPIKDAIKDGKIISNLGSIIRDLSKKYPVWMTSLDGIDLSEFDEK